MIGETEVVNIDERAVDWAQIEGEYVTGKDSLKTLSERYGLALKTVKKHSAAGKWSEKRKKYAAKKAERVSERLHERDVKQTVRDIERCCAAAGKLIDKVNAAIRQLDKTVYVSLDDIELQTQENDENGVNVLHTVKKRRMQTRQQKAPVDTKRLSELAKALVNIKAVLTGEDGRADDSEHSGVIEIAAANAIDPREEATQE